MPRTIEIHDVDDATYEALVQRAAALGLSVPEMLRQELGRLAARTTMDDWLARTRRSPEQRTERDTVEALDQVRGGWPS